MDLGISGRTALIMGGSRGLGKAIAGALAAEGARVVIASRDARRLEEAAQQITAASGNTVVAMPADGGNLEALRGLAAAISESFGGVDILINNTGGPPRGLMTEVAADVWRRQFETMVLGVISLTQYCLPHMIQAGWGRVITVCSSGVVQPIPHLGISNTLRSSLIAWSKTLANEVAAKGITVNCLLPGRIHTDRVDELDLANAKQSNMTIEDVRKASSATIPIGRYGKAEEFAAAAAFLAGVPAGYITGSVIRVDGGMIRSV